MDEIVKKFRGKAVEAAEVSAECRGAARAYAECAEVVFDYATGKPKIVVPTPPPNSPSPAQIAQQISGKGPSRRQIAKAGQPDIQDAIADVLRDAIGVLHESEILARLNSAGFSYDIRQVRSGLRRASSQGKATKCGAYYGAAGIVK